MDELIGWLVGIAIVVAFIIWLIMMIVLAILWVLSAIYTALVWSANAFLAGLDIMIGFGETMPLWIAWAMWGTVLGATLGLASSASWRPYRRPLLIAPPCLALLIGVARSLS